MDSPIWLAILAILAIPAVTSAVTGAIKWLASTTGIGARVWVYSVSLVVTGLIIVGGGFPVVTGDPAVVVGAWLGWATVNAELARRIYELLWERVGQEPASLFDTDY